MRGLNILSSIQGLPRDLRYLFLSLFLFTFGLGLYNYVWSIYLRQLNASPDQVGLVFFIGFIAAALSMMPGAILANKYELRLLLIISGAMGIPPPLIYYYAQNWTQAIPGVILFQVSAFAIPAFNAYIVGAGDKDKMASAFGATYSAAPLGIVFSPALGSLLLNWFHIRDLFILAFVFFTLSTIVILPMKTQPAIKHDLDYPKFELPSSRVELVLLLFITGSGVAYTITNPFLPLYFQDADGLSEASILLLGAAQNLGGTLLFIILGRRAESKGQGRTMALGLLLASSGLLGIMTVKSYPVSFPMVFLFGSARAPTLIAYSLLSRMSGSRAGKFGFYLTLENLGFVAGSYIGGAIYTISPIGVLVTTLFSFLVLAVFSVYQVKLAPGSIEQSTSEISHAIQTLVAERDYCSKDSRSSRCQYLRPMHFAT